MGEPMHLLERQEGPAGPIPIIQAAQLAAAVPAPEDNHDNQGPAGPIPIIQAAPLAAAAAVPAPEDNQEDMDYI